MRLKPAATRGGAFTVVGFVLIAGAAACGVALAQSDLPNKPIRIVVGFAAGGPSDLVARIVGTKTGEILGRSVVVENKTGAGGMIAVEAVARAEPDGSTLSNTATSVAVNESMPKSIRVEFGKDLVAVAPQAETANVLVVHPSLGVKTTAELIALAKTKPGELLYASAGRGSATHLSAETFNMMAGTRMMPVHYRGGGDAIKDLLSGQVKIMFANIAPVLGFVNQGKLIGLGVTGPMRDHALPGIPTVAESGLPGFDVRYWVGLSAPRGTPRDVIKLIEAANNKALALPEVQTALAAQGFSPWIGTAEDFDRFYRAERDKYAKVIQASGMDKE
ncbi:MAG: tripartite tricarboxylate transporter substrate binding protein [Hyphomicrobiales bacterium]|nr:tripartite tricarboxylate transporter substrate binding protein [Alphaproteobacteria bacterium]